MRQADVEKGGSATNAQNHNFPLITDKDVVGFVVSASMPFGSVSHRLRPPPDNHFSVDLISLHFYLLPHK